MYYLGAGTSFDLSETFPNQYKNLTEDNFIVAIFSGSVYGSTYNTSVSGSASISKSYNPDTGKLTISGTSISANKDGAAWGHASASLSVGVYLVIGKIE